MSRLRVALLGASGRMGKTLQDLIQNDPKIREEFILVDLEDKAQVLIDFSAPEASLKASKICAKNKTAHLVCTTGFSNDEKKQLEKNLNKTKWALVPNTSLGVFVLGEVLKKAVSMLPENYDVNLVEIHHSAKKDAPSGTGKYLAKILEESGGRKDFPVISIRGGTEPGEHKVTFLGPAERLEFLHRAENRSLFAFGALRLAKVLAKMKSRSKAYTPSELFTVKS